jgi:hypothetical protein
MRAVNAVVDLWMMMGNAMGSTAAQELQKCLATEVAWLSGWKLPKYLLRCERDEYDEGGWGGEGRADATCARGRPRLTIA